MSRQLSIFDSKPRLIPFYERPKKVVFVGQWVYYESNLPSDQRQRLIGKVTKLEPNGYFCWVYFPERQIEWHILCTNTIDIEENINENNPLPIRT